MSIFLTLLRRELASFFCSLTGYVIIAAVTLVIGLSFVLFVRNLAGADPTPMPVTELFFNSQMFWLILILMTPVITMRLFALEKATGTFETLMTTPVRDVQVVAAKFLAAVIFYVIAWLPAVGSLLIVQHFTNQPRLDLGTFGGLYLGIFLSGCLFLSMGGFASSLTRSQMVSAVVSLSVGILFYVLAYMANVLPDGGQTPSEPLYYFNLFGQMEDFTRGVVDTRTLIFYATATLFFLFLTLRVVESRRWK